MNPKNVPLTTDEIAEASGYIMTKNMESLSIFLTARLNQRWLKLDALCKALNKYIEADRLDKAVLVWETVAKDYKPQPGLAVVLIGGAVIWKLAVFAAVIGGVVYLIRSCS